jgi:hypothetical protein
MAAVDLTAPSVVPRIVDTTLGAINIVRVLLVPSGPGWSINFYARDTDAKIADASNALTEGGAFGTSQYQTLPADRLVSLDLSSYTSGTLYLASATAAQVIELTLTRDNNGA